MDAADGEADVIISGGGGTDTAYYDLGLDPVPIAVEFKIAGGGGGGGGTPPSGGPCSYDGVTKTLVARIPAGGAATLSVVDGAIAFATPLAQDCAGATTTNTEAITVLGESGSLEQLTIDQTGGAFAPGVTPETGTGALSEIEITASLGDTGDSLLLLGGPEDDAIAVGTKGLAVNLDAGIDVTLDTLPAGIEVRGGGGVNTLGGKGGFGSGAAYTGVLTLVAGDGGDSLSGGSGNDLLTGGAGDDTIEGRDGDDTISGGGGSDLLSGNAGNDAITGGAGADTLAGGDGDDLLRADDGEADTTISGGAGTDTAHYDGVLDPLPVQVENKIPV
jgi:Ca2+-binding RTX toxin-like protein